MLSPKPFPPIPAETARIARVAFPRGRAYPATADVLGEVCTDDTVAALFPARGKPVPAPWRLALVAILHFAGGLSNRRAADAVRAWLDRECLLRLEPTGRTASLIAWKKDSRRGRATEKSGTSVARWALRLSRMA